MITELTPEQEAMKAVIRDRFIAYGLSTDPMDWEKAKQAICDAHKNAGMVPPTRFIAVRSPAAGARAYCYITNGEIDKILPPTDGSIFSTVPPIDKKAYRNIISSALNNVSYGQHDAGWLSFYAYFHAIGIEEAGRMEPLWRICASAGWYWMWEDVALISDRPELLLRDEAHRLHAENGMALRYRDGMGIYSWHGYRIPLGKEWIITDKKRITAKAIFDEPNAELRRVMCEVTAFAPVLDKGKLISEDVDVNGFPRRLMSIMVGDQEIRFIQVTNGSLEPDGTRRTFVLGAMPGSTPHEVIAASYGISPKYYKEALRT